MSNLALKTKSIFKTLKSKSFYSTLPGKIVAFSGFVTAVGGILAVIQPTLAFINSIPSILFDEDYCSTEYPQQLVHAETKGFDIYLCSTIDSALPKEYHGIEKGENGQQITLRDGKDGTSIYQRDDSFIIVNRANDGTYEYRLSTEQLNILKGSSVISSDRVTNYEISNE